jgi:peptidoglycan hydrolase-like protein with peptidoglycan-binding domain
MRPFAAILAVILGSSAALAQSDPRANPAPAVDAKPAAKPEAKVNEPNKDTKQETTKKEGKAKQAKAKQAKAKQDKADAKTDTKAEDGAEAQTKPSRKERTAAKSKAVTTGSAPASATPAKPSGLQDTYAAIPPAERMALQNDLTWGGDFTGPIDGEFSERLVTAVKAYQSRHKNPVTGVMSPAERAALATAVEPRKQEVGWRLVEDPVIGARVGLPGKFATKTVALQNGTRWSSDQGQMQVETFRIDTGATLEAVFEQQKKMPRRRIESNALQADSFVITGMQGLKKMVVRGYARNGEVRGITILYDQAMEGTVDQLVTPMSSAFVPFTSGFAVAGSPDAPRRKVEYGTGLFVSANGHVLTDRNLIDGCNVIALPGLGNAERIATDAGGEIALLRVYGARNLTPIGMIGSAAPGGPGLALVGVPDPQAQSGGAAISAVNARLGAEASTRPLESAPALGFAGAAALDAQGRFAGMVVMKAPVVAGPGRPPQAAVVPVERIRNFLEANYVAPTSRQARRRGHQGLGDAGDLRPQVGATYS